MIKAINNVNKFETSIYKFELKVINTEIYIMMPELTVLEGQLIIYFCFEPEAILIQQINL